MPTNDELLDECMDKNYEIAALQAVVDRLARTADGFPMVPGDKVHGHFRDGIVPGIYVGIYTPAPEYRCRFKPDAGFVDAEDCHLNEDGEFCPTLGSIYSTNKPR